MLDRSQAPAQSPTFSTPPTNTRLLATVLALCVPLGCAGGCNRSSEPAQPRYRTEGVRIPIRSGSSTPDAGGRAAATPEGADAGADAAAPPWPGPYFTVISSSTGIYAQPIDDRSLKLGYARNGGRIPVLPNTLDGERGEGPSAEATRFEGARADGQRSDGCRDGWYQGVDGGYICASDGTIDPADPRARLSATPPDLDGVLPYPYARAARNGTPLYSSVPSVDQMALYEPRVEREAQGGEGGSAARPWWRRDRVQLSQVRLAELASESDGLLAKRLVQGFYIAIDREFEWGAHTWYKTTKGMVAAKNRFVAVEASGFRGVELAEGRSLPVAWAYGPRETRPRFQIDATGVKELGTFPRWSALHLTGQKTEVGGRTYLETVDTDWVQADHVRVASAPSQLPSNLATDERWISVDLRTQTLIALVGERAVYTTLVSSGKETNDVATDHRTPSGEWYIREKHITTTMDGDGTAAGDLPYSIEDVPYAMYFDGSYALHGAFWHRNYGVRMSHGCINLAPLDARYLFFFTDPPVRAGWHGAWSGNGQNGSRVVISGSTPLSDRARLGLAPRPLVGTGRPLASPRP